MPATTPAPAMPKISHEHFCMPRPDATEPRIEGFWAARVDRNGVESGRIRVTRCLECGAARYTTQETG